MPGYKREQEVKRLLAFPGSSLQDLGGFKMYSLCEASACSCSCPREGQQQVSPDFGEQMGFATSPALQCLGKPGSEKGDFASFYKAEFILSVNQ